MEWHNWLLRLCLSASTYYLLRNQMGYITRDRAVYDCGLLHPYVSNPVGSGGGTKPVKSFAYALTALRQLVTCAAIIIFNVYIFTVDHHGEETSLDLLKDFAALVILIHIGHFMRNAVNVEAEELLKIYELQFIPLEVKYERYLDFDKQRRERH